MSGHYDGTTGSYNMMPNDTMPMMPGGTTENYNMNMPGFPGGAFGNRDDNFGGFNNIRDRFNQKHYGNQNNNDKEDSEDNETNGGNNED
jgi:hypothetical protein